MGIIPACQNQRKPSVEAKFPPDRQFYAKFDNEPGTQFQLNNRPIQSLLGDIENQFQLYGLPEPHQQLVISRMFAPIEKNTCQSTAVIKISGDDSCHQKWSQKLSSIDDLTQIKSIDDQFNCACRMTIFIDTKGSGACSQQLKPPPYKALQQSSTNYFKGKQLNPTEQSPLLISNTSQPLPRECGHTEFHILGSGMEWASKSKNNSIRNSTDITSSGFLQEGNNPVKSYSFRLSTEPHSEKKIPHQRGRTNLDSMGIQKVYVEPVLRLFGCTADGIGKYKVNGAAFMLNPKDPLFKGPGGELYQPYFHQEIRQERDGQKRIQIKSEQIHRTGSRFQSIGSWAATALSLSRVYSGSMQLINSDKKSSPIIQTASIGEVGSGLTNTIGTILFAKGAASSAARKFSQAASRLRGSQWTFLVGNILSGVSAGIRLGYYMQDDVDIPNKSHRVQSAAMDLGTSAIWGGFSGSALYYAHKASQAKGAVNVYFNQFGALGIRTLIASASMITSGFQIYYHLQQIDAIEQDKHLNEYQKAMLINSHDNLIASSVLTGVGGAVAAFTSWTPVGYILIAGGLLIAVVDATDQ